MFLLFLWMAGEMSHENGLSAYVQKKEGPTWVFLHGSGDCHVVFKPLIREMGHISAVAFDSPGHGKSRYVQLAATHQQFASDVHDALKTWEVPGPFILVGASWGGLTALEYAHIFGNQIKAVVLLDPSHPDMLLRFRQKDGSFKWQKIRERGKNRTVPEPNSTPVSNDEGQKFVPRYGFADHAVLNDDDQAWLKSVSELEVFVPKGLSTYSPEELQLMMENWDQYQLNQPLLLLAAGRVSKNGDADWSEKALLEKRLNQHQDLLNLSRDSSHLTLLECGHRMFLDDPAGVADMMKRWIRNYP